MGSTFINHPSVSGRRQIMAGLGALFATPTCAATAESPTYGLMVAGPVGGRTDRWADLLIPAIDRGLAGKSPVTRENLGGIDGVTGANQFEARAEPDGTTGLLIPGGAMLSWLTGEMRARFDPSRWVSLWVGLGSVALFSHVPLSQAGPFRIAASGPTGPELPVLMALDILGIKAALVLPEASGAAVLVGPFSALTTANVMPAGMRPVLTFGALTKEGSFSRDPAYPDIPTIFELTNDRAPNETLVAMRATAMATQLDVGLVLPGLTPASSVALWRRACASLALDPAVQQLAGRVGTRQPAPDQVALCTSSIAGSSGTLLTLRRWLATTYGWRPT